MRTPTHVYNVDSFVARGSRLIWHAFFNLVTVARLVAILFLLEVDYNSCWLQTALQYKN